MILFLFLACTSSKLPQGYWSLQGIDSQSSGAISIKGDEAYVDLYGPSWNTQGSVLAEIEQSKEWLWLYFPLITGQGEGTAALRFQGGEAMLPLGARRGEFEVYFSAVPSEEIDFEEKKLWAQKQVEKEKEYWKNHSTVLKIVTSLYFTGYPLPLYKN